MTLHLRPLTCLYHKLPFQVTKKKKEHAEPPGFYPFPLKAYKNFPTQKVLVQFWFRLDTTLSKPHDSVKCLLNT